MASITGWTRLEPRPRSRNFDVSLQARVRDPLWMLTRQWQIGEFIGSDGGNAVSARVEVGVFPLNRYRGGNSDLGQAYEVTGLPLEALIERESLVQSTEVDLQGAVETGLYFIRILKHIGLSDRYREAYLSRYPLSEPQGTDERAIQLYHVYKMRALDGYKLAKDVKAALAKDPIGLPQQPNVLPEDVNNMLAATQRWLTWFEKRFSETSDAQQPWIDRRLEYQFSVSATTDDGETVLTASEYQGRDLDWYSFDRDPSSSISGEAGSGIRQELKFESIPTNVEFPGMPASRWWEMEEGSVDLAAVDGSPHDVVRMLLLGFALVYGNDWLMLPVRLPIGTLSRINQLVITDSFGKETKARAANSPTSQANGWSMFDLAISKEPPAGVNSQVPYLFLPPILASQQVSEPIEEVLLIRDEMANLAWAIERVVLDSSGRPVDRSEVYQQHVQMEPVTEQTPVDGADVIYQTATSVPDYWIPLVPVSREGDTDSIVLQRGTVHHPESPFSTNPRSVFLAPDRQLFIEDEEVPRSGIRLTRRTQMARWGDANLIVWVGREKSIGRGEGSSGLRYDIITEG